MKLLSPFLAVAVYLPFTALAQEKPSQISAAGYPSIQAAIDANPGRVIEVPPGDYLISEKIRLKTDNSGLTGSGRIIQTDSEKPIIEVAGHNHVELRGLTLTRPEGKMDTRAEAIIVSRCRDLVLENLRVLDNRTRAAAISLNESTASQIRNCLVENYMRISVDDRTANPELGYAFKCIDGTGISVERCVGALVQGNRVIERNMLPTPEIQKQYDLGKFTKKNAQKGIITNQKMWDAEYMSGWHQGSAIIINNPEISDCTQVLGNYIENAAQGLDIHADHVIISQNIINNAFIGMKAMHGSRNILITGNQFVRNDLWAIGLMPGVASHVAMPAADGKPARGANVDGGSIIANNIISDFGYGNAHWMWGNDGNPMRFDHGQKADNPPLTDVIIQGNVVYDTGRDQILVDGQPQVEKPRYKYAIRIEDGGNAPKNLHFSNNILHPGSEGVSNVQLPP